MPIVGSTGASEVGETKQGDSEATSAVVTSSAATDATDVAIAIPEAKQRKHHFQSSYEANQWVHHRALQAAKVRAERANAYWGGRPLRAYQRANRLMSAISAEFRNMAVTATFLFFGVRSSAIALKPERTESDLKEANFYSHAFFMSSYALAVYAIARGFYQARSAKLNYYHQLTQDRLSPDANIDAYYDDNHIADTEVMLAKDVSGRCIITQQRLDFVERSGVAQLDRFINYGHYIAMMGLLVAAVTTTHGIQYNLLSAAGILTIGRLWAAYNLPDRVAKLYYGAVTNIDLDKTQMHPGYTRGFRYNMGIATVGVAASVLSLVRSGGDKTIITKSVWCLYLSAQFVVYAFEHNAAGIKDLAEARKLTAIRNVNENKAGHDVAVERRLAHRQFQVRGRQIPLSTTLIVNDQIRQVIKLALTFATIYSIAMQAQSEQDVQLMLTGSLGLITGVAAMAYTVGAWEAFDYSRLSRNLETVAVGIPETDMAATVEDASSDHGAVIRAGAT